MPMPMRDPIPSTDDQTEQEVSINSSGVTLSGKMPIRIAASLIFCQLLYVPTSRMA